MGKRRLIRSRRCERIVNIGHLQNTRQQWYLFTFQSVRVARAVPPLVMAADDGKNRRQSFHGPADFLAADGMHAHHLPLFSAQETFIEENRVRNSDLANVMQVAAPVQGQLVRPRHSQRLAQLYTVGSQSLTMQSRVAVARFDRLRQSEKDGFGLV